MKTIWFCMLLSLLSILAYSGFSDAVNGAEQLLSEAPASSSIAATPQSLETPVGPIALDASSGRWASGTSGNDGGLAARLSAVALGPEAGARKLAANRFPASPVCSTVTRGRRTDWR